MVCDKVVLKLKEKNKESRRIKKFWRKIYEVGGLPTISKHYKAMIIERMFYWRDEIQCLETDLHIW